MFWNTRCLLFIWYNSTTFDLIFSSCCKVIIFIFLFFCRYAKLDFYFNVFLTETNVWTYFGIDVIFLLIQQREETYLPIGFDWIKQKTRKKEVILLVSTVFAKVISNFYHYRNFDRQKSYFRFVQTEQLRYLVVKRFANTI